MNELPMSIPTTVDDSRLVGLMQALQEVAKLREQLTNTQIGFREKRREAASKREIVCERDAKFMRQLQQFIARGPQGLPGDFKRLEVLADACQSARDDLGPVEQEGIEAERQWEGQAWSLWQAENHVYKEFDYEFRIAASYPPASSSEDCSQYSFDSQLEFEEEEAGNPLTEIETNPPSWLTHSRALSTRSLHRNSRISSTPNIVVNTEEPLLLGLIESNETGARRLEPSIDVWDLESDSEDIDRIIRPRISERLRESFQALPGRHYSSELYSNLLMDFGSTRNRINRWLEHIALGSRIEATSVFTILGDRLKTEGKEMPTNWAQLVVAYWELDGATIPVRKFPLAQNRIEEQSNGQENGREAQHYGLFDLNATMELQETRSPAKSKNCLVPSPPTSDSNFDNDGRVACKECQPPSTHPTVSTVSHLSRTSRRAFEE